MTEKPLLSSKLVVMLGIVSFFLVMIMAYKEAHAAQCSGWNPILCENGITYYPSSPNSVSGPFYENYFNPVENKWMSAGPFCSVSWSSPVTYSYKYLRADSGGGCGGWWTTGLNFISLTVQYPGQAQKDESYWVGAVNHLP